MRKILVIWSFIFTAVSLNAQQIGLPNHYFYKPMVYNPAYTGTGEAVNAMVVSKSQWTNFKNAPQLNIFTLDGNLMNKKMGLGLKLLSDRKGLSSSIGGDLSYSYRLTFNEEMHLSFGLALGVLDHRVNYSKAVVENNSDPALINDDAHKTAFDGNAGLMFKWKNLVVAASAPHLLENKTTYFDTYSRSRYTQARHYMGTVNYKFNVMADKGVSISPQVLVRYLPNAPFQFDANLTVDWENKFWVGATYKNDYAVAANAGISISKQLYIGYSYDFMVGKITKYAGVSHEIMLNFKFGNRAPEVIKEEVAVTPITAPVVEDNKILENKAYETKIENLENQLKDNEARLKMLADKIEEQSKIQQRDNNKNIEAVESNKNKVQEQGIWLVTNKTKEFIDNENHEPEKGFYVVVGTFSYRDLAIAETQRFREKGYKSNWVYYDQKKYNYVYTERVLGKEDALNKAQGLRTAGIKDVWIQILVK